MVELCEVWWHNLGTKLQTELLTEILSIIHLYATLFILHEQLLVDFFCYAAYRVFVCSTLYCENHFFLPPPWGFGSLKTIQKVLKLNLFFHLLMSSCISFSFGNICYSRAVCVHVVSSLTDEFLCQLFCRILRKCVYVCAVPIPFYHSSLYFVFHFRNINNLHAVLYSLRKMSLVISFEISCLQSHVYLLEVYIYLYTVELASPKKYILFSPRNFLIRLT